MFYSATITLVPPVTLVLHGLLPLHPLYNIPVLLHNIWHLPLSVCLSVSIPLLIRSLWTGIFGILFFLIYLSQEIAPHPPLSLPPSLSLSSPPPLSLPPSVCLSVSVCPSIYTIFMNRDLWYLIASKISEPGNRPPPIPLSLPPPPLSLPSSLCLSVCLSLSLFL